MSSYFYINLVNKNTKEETCLFNLYTTPARELDEGVNLAYDKSTLLTKDFFIEICDYYKKQIKEREENIKRNEEDQSKLFSTISNATSKEVVNELYDIILEDNKNIDWCKEEIKEKEKYLSDLEQVWEILELNTDFGVNGDIYELWYYFS